ncbi:MAG: HAD family hydrolase [Dehalococcoidia bacterium]|nr:HAD family hydrolase [Dehalococcoidia bacterium]
MLHVDNRQIDSPDSRGYHSFERYPATYRRRFVANRRTICIYVRLITIENTHETAGRKLLSIICDFDGTITNDDVAVAMLTAFGTGDWVRWYHAYLDGELSLEESLKRQFESVRATKRQLLEFVHTNTTIRPGFAEFVEFCQARGMPLVIASVGLDFYIRAVLKEAGISIPELVCGNARFSGGRLHISYPDLGRDGLAAGIDLKERTVERLREGDRTIAYIGDGFPDFPAARRCDFVFARHNLADKCRENEVGYLPFDDFYDVLDGLERFNAVPGLAQ